MTWIREQIEAKIAYWTTRGFSRSLASIFFNNKIFTEDQLLGKTEQEILGFEGLGHKKMDEIKAIYPEAFPDSPQVSFDEALTHLGNVLHILADLVPDDRCAALDTALAFYNQHRPDAQVAPTNVWKTYLINVHPVLGIGAPERDLLIALIAKSSN